MDLPEYEEDYKKGVYANLTTGKKALESGLPGVAFVRALWTCENALKAVLVKSKKFIKKRPPEGDLHHDCWKLFLKIQEKGILPHGIRDEVHDTIYDLLWVNIKNKTGNTHMNTAPPQTGKLIGDIRYLDLDEYIIQPYAAEKIAKASRIVELLESLM